MRLAIIQTKKWLYQLVDLDDVRTECVALLGMPTWVIGYEYGTDLEVDGYYVDYLNEYNEVI